MTGKDNMTGATDLIEALDKGIEAIDGPKESYGLSQTTSMITAGREILLMQTLWSSIIDSGLTTKYERYFYFQYPKRSLMAQTPQRVMLPTELFIRKTRLRSKSLSITTGIIRGTGIKQKANS